MKRTALPVLMALITLAVSAVLFFSGPLGSDSPDTLELTPSEPADRSMLSSAESPSHHGTNKSVEIATGSVTKESSGPVQGVRFPDGDEIQVRLRTRSPAVIVDNQHSTTLSLLEAYQQLTDALVESPAAAFQVHELKEHCDLLFEEARRQGHFDPQYYSGPWGTTTVQDGSGQSRLDLLDAAQRHFGECQTLKNRGLDDTDWLQKAVEGGSSDAFKMQGRRLGKTSAAVEMFERAWQSGEIFSTVWLSSLYASGFETEDGRFVQDAKLAFAYQYLFASLNALKYQDRGGNSTPIVQSAWSGVAQMEQRLHPHEREDAYQMAKSLLHDECCLK